MSVVDPFTRSRCRYKGVAIVDADNPLLLSTVLDSRASEREVRGCWRDYFDQLNSGLCRITIAGTFCALPRIGQSAAIAAIALATPDKSGPRRTGSMRALPQARAA